MKDDNKYYATMCGFWFNPDKVEITKPFVKEIKIDKDPEPIDWTKIDFKKPEYTKEQIEQAGSVLEHTAKKEQANKTLSDKMREQGLNPLDLSDWMIFFENEVSTKEKEYKSSLDIAAEMAKEKTNTQEHYKGKDSLYKFAEEWKLNTYEFDILKRIVRCRHKGNFAEDLDKTIDLIKIYKKEQKDLHGK